MFRSLLLVALLVCPLLAQAQTVTMPQSVLAVRGRTAQVEIVYDGDDLKWSTPPELDVFREWSEDVKVVSLRVLVPPETRDGNYQIQAVTTKVVDGKARLSKFQTCLVNVGGSPPVVVTPPTTPTIPTVPTTPPVVTPDNKATAVTLVHEKNYALPAPVLAALNKLNQRGIVATLFMPTTTDGTGDVPDQYKVPAAAAKEAGLPALVVTAGAKVLKVVKDPRTEDDVIKAVP